MNKLSSERPPFSAKWFFPGLGRYRRCDATYCHFPYESLPPLDESLFQGTLHWLTPLNGRGERGMDHYHSEADLQQIVASAQQLSIPLPGTFLQLMASAELMERIPSCTDCFFSLSEKLVACPGSEEGYIVRFLIARQGQIAWYLYLTPQGSHCVLCGWPLLDLLNDPESPEYIRAGVTDEERSMAFTGKVTHICALSFEEFLHRFWLENILWFKIVWHRDYTSLTEKEERYLSHYY